LLEAFWKQTNEKDKDRDHYKDKNKTNAKTDTTTRTRTRTKTKRQETRQGIGFESQRLQVHTFDSSYFDSEGIRNRTQGEKKEGPGRKGESRWRGRERERDERLRERGTERRDDLTKLNLRSNATQPTQANNK
jgi:hypothetical protein